MPTPAEREQLKKELQAKWSDRDFAVKAGKPVDACGELIPPAIPFIPSELPTSFERNWEDAVNYHE